MTIFKKKKKEPVRLHKQEPKKDWKEYEMQIIQLGIAIGIILIILLFILLCFMLIPSTHGFYWW